MTGPEFEVFVPVRNGGALLSECLDSLLNQTDDDFRITVVDNASADDTPERVQKLADIHERLTLRRFEDGVDLAGNFNRCMDLAQADYFALVHADDRVRPNYVAGMKSAIRRHSDAWLVFCQGALIDDDGSPYSSLKHRMRARIYERRGPVLKDLRGLKHLASYNHLMAPCAAFRRDKMSSELRFDGAHTYLVDQVFWLQVLLAGGTIGQVPDELYEHRVHSGQLSATLRGSGSTLDEIRRFAPALETRPSVLRAWRRYGHMMSLRKRLMQLIR